MITADNGRMTFLAPVCKTHSYQKMVVVFQQVYLAIVPINCGFFIRYKQILLPIYSWFVVDFTTHQAVVFPEI
jgi:hypothetical protein